MLKASKPLISTYLFRVVIDLFVCCFNRIVITDYYKQLPTTQLRSLIDNAKSTSNKPFDIVSKTAMTVLEEQCPNEDAALVLQSMLKECQLSLSMDTMLRLRLLLIYELGIYFFFAQ